MINAGSGVGESSINKNSTVSELHRVDGLFGQADGAVGGIEGLVGDLPFTVPVQSILVPGLADSEGAVGIDLDVGGEEGTA